MTGTIALIGSGEFLPPIRPLDQKLLAHLQEPPRVVVLPTASAPDGAGVPERWANMGVTHFTALGAQAEPVMLLTREDADNPAIVERIAQANFVYFSGGKPRYLLETLQETAAWAAIEALYARGGIVAGCSAGAIVMGAAIHFPRSHQSANALNLAPGLVIIPHFDEIPKLVRAAFNHANPYTLVGVDGSTALVGQANRWTVYGTSGVTVFEEKRQVRYIEGEEVRLPSPPHS